jgi:hypothetical protein
MQTLNIIHPPRLRMAATLVLMLAGIIPAGAQTSVATPMAPPPPPLAGPLTSPLQGITSAPVAKPDTPATAAQPASPGPQAASPSGVR